MANNYSGRNSLVFEKTDRHRLGRIKGEWEDAMIAEIPEANERAWNQGAEEVTDGDVDSQAEVKAIGDWYRRKLAESQAGSQPAAQEQPSEELVAARQEWDQYEDRRGEGSIHYDPTSGRAPGVVDGVGAAAKYGNDATDDYFNRFIPHLNAQANLEALEIGDSGSRHLDRFEGEVPELASGEIKDLYDYYSKKITETA